jgi:hypothetical protein
MRRSNGRAFVASAFTVAAGLLLVAVVYFVQRPGRVEAAKHVELQQQPPPNYQFTPLQTMPQYQAQQSMPPLQQYAPASQSPMVHGVVQNPQPGYPPPPALAQEPAPAPVPAIDTAAVDPMAPSFVVPPTPSGAFSSPCSVQFTVQALGLHQHDKITLALVSGPPGSSITTPITSNPGSTIFTWQPTPQQLQQGVLSQQACFQARDRTGLTRNKCIQVSVSGGQQCAPKVRGHKPQTPKPQTPNPEPRTPEPETGSRKSGDPEPRNPCDREMKIDVLGAPERMPLYD